MINFKIKNNLIDIEFNSIKIIYCDNTTQIIKEIYKSNSLTIDDQKIKEQNMIYINDFSKIKDFVSLTKNSNITSDINNIQNEANQLINQNWQMHIVNEINQKYNFEIIDWIEGDNAKLISNLFEIKNEYLDFSMLDALLKNYFESNSNVFILDNVSWITKNEINVLKNYLNSNKFLIFTNDLRNFITTINDFELFALVDCKGNYFDVIDNEKMISFLEKELNTQIDNNILKEISINKNSFISIDFISKIKKLIQ